MLLGVDEAGRGPLAGPVAIGVVAVPLKFDIRKAFPGLKDSKLLTPQKREEIFTKVRVLEKEGTLRYIVVFSSAASIDKRGIVRAIRSAVFRGIRILSPEPHGVKVLLDGLLTAPSEYVQKTVIRGDQTEPVISLASVVAKVRRDRLMRRLAKLYPDYQFDIHKGYGTKAHGKSIKKFGLSDIHRRSFCKNLSFVA